MTVMTNIFKFKQFTVNQNNCAMKVGTDSVLLGAWTSVNHHPFSVLDIGAGTGLLSLMLAQRTEASVIEAIEIDENAYEQCVENFENSPWKDRLFCYHASLLEFVEEVDDKFDTIICNPPFYQEDFKTNNESRNLARFQDAMPFEHLVYATTQLLSEKGIFSVIIPETEEENFVELAIVSGLFLNRKTTVKGQPHSRPKRVLLEFSLQQKELISDELIIELYRHHYTQDYINLTKDFYLKM